MAKFAEEDLPLLRAARGEAPALKPVSVRPPLGIYLRQLWRRRHFIRMQAWALALNQHQGTLLGNLWLIVGPVLDGMVYFFIFGFLFPRGGDIENFIGYVFIGVFLFSFTARSLTGCVRAIDGSRALIRAFTFPRAALPIAVVVRELIALLPVLYAMVIMLLVVPPKAELSWLWVLVPAVIALQAIFNLGAGLIVARLGARIPDIQHVMSYAIRFLMYGSAVIFSINRFDRFPVLKEVVMNSPTFLTLDMTRKLMLWGELPTSEQWLKLIAWAVGLLVVGFLYFWQAEVKYARRAHE